MAQQDKRDISQTTTQNSGRPVENLSSPQQRVAELEQQVTQLREQLTATQSLRQMALDITGRLKVPPLLETIVQRASDLMNATGGIVYLRPDPDSPWVEAVASCNLGQDYRGVRLSLGEGIGGQVTQSGQPLIVRDCRQWPDKSPQLQDAPFRAALAAPLTWHGHTHGTLQIIDLSGERIFNQDDLRLLMPLADQAAIAIKNARLFEKERRQREAASALHQAAEAISHSLDLEQILSLLMDQLAKLVPYDSSTIQLLEHESLHVVAMRGFPAAITRQDITWGDMQNETWQTILSSKKLLIIPDVRDDPRWEILPGLEYIRSWIGVPIITRDWIWGILTLDKAEPGFYGQREAEQTATVAR